MVVYQHLWKFICTFAYIRAISGYLYALKFLFLLYICFLFREFIDQYVYIIYVHINIMIFCLCDCLLVHFYACMTIKFSFMAVCKYAFIFILARSPDDPQRIRVASVFEFSDCSLFSVCLQIFSISFISFHSFAYSLYWHFIHFNF